MNLETLKLANELKDQISLMEYFLQEIEEYKKAIDYADGLKNIQDVEISIIGCAPLPYSYQRFSIKVPEYFVNNFLLTLQISFFANEAALFIERAKKHLDSL